MERGDNNLADYLRFEFSDPCVVPSQALARTRSMPVPIVPPLLHSFSRPWAGDGASAESRGSGAGWEEGGFHKAWGRHLAGPSEVQGTPGLRTDLLARICPRQHWAEMGYLQSMGRDGARELRGLFQLWLRTHTSHHDVQCLPFSGSFSCHCAWSTHPGGPSPKALQLLPLTVAWEPWSLGGPPVFPSLPYQTRLL